ncbi:uncharacterized protein LOC118177114 isoform X1 [Oxyura jamaicensis]|uniref:uncharacterized protein LOC118177114 isoform X1 n=1 Tax=Oxyura jamaicensis TaxID=8884 RepID=UPI0015A5119A|nr:uncharacterized protein LOC118177114 isoform X1 [Oxyura jamaicensis]
MTNAKDPKRAMDSSSATSSPAGPVTFSQVFGQQCQLMEAAVESLHSLNDQISHFIVNKSKTLDEDEDAFLPSEKESLKSAMMLMRHLLMDAQKRVMLLKPTSSAREAGKLPEAVHPKAGFYCLLYYQRRETWPSSRREAARSSRCHLQRLCSTFSPARSTLTLPRLSFQRKKTNAEDVRGHCGTSLLSLTPDQPRECCRSHKASVGAQSMPRPKQGAHTLSSWPEATSLKRLK